MLNLKILDVMQIRTVIIIVLFRDKNTSNMLISFYFIYDAVLVASNC